MVMSIMNRVTGLALSFGLVLLTWWLVSLASGPESFRKVHGIAGSWFGLLVLFGFTVAWAYHLCSSMRHLFWDAGYGLDLQDVKKTNVLVLGGAALLTVLVWIGVVIAS